MRLAPLLALALCPAALSAQLLDEVPRTAIVSAFPPEIVALQGDISDPATFTDNGVTFTTGTLEGEPVVLFLSGVSMVNAAMTTQLAIDRFEIERIVFSGIAGGADPALDIGDVVVAQQWGPYLQGVAGRADGDGYTIPPWMSSDFANFGMFHTVTFGVAAGDLTEPDGRFWFEADPELLALAEEVAADVTLGDCTDSGACLTEAPQIVVGGNGVSGPLFVDNAELRQHLYDTFGAQVIDMETAAVGQVAFANDVPFIAFRSLSDLAGGGDGENEMNTFMSLAAGSAASVLKAFVAALNE